MLQSADPLTSLNPPFMPFGATLCIPAIAREEWERESGGQGREADLDRLVCLYLLLFNVCVFISLNPFSFILSMFRSHMIPPKLRILNDLEPVFSKQDPRIDGGSPLVRAS